MDRLFDYRRSRAWSNQEFSLNWLRHMLLAEERRSAHVGSEEAAPPLGRGESDKEFRSKNVHIS